MTTSRRERDGRRPAALLSRLGILSAAAVAAYVFESLLPVPLPWARIGLSNVVVVIALFGYGLKDALIVNLGRIIVGNLLVGLILSPAFVFSVAGSMAALVAMGIAKWKLVPPLSVVGTSVLGAVASNVAQVLVFTKAFAPSDVTQSLLGIFLLLGAAVGFVTGLVAAMILDKVSLARPGAVG